jgi:hypothetical protein
VRAKRTVIPPSGRIDTLASPRVPGRRLLTTSTSPRASVTLIRVTTPADPRTAAPQTSLRRLLAAAAGGAVVTWLLWHFAFGDSTGRSTVQAVLIFIVMTAFMSFGRWSLRRRQR